MPVSDSANLRASAFDLLRAGTDLTPQPYDVCRRALEQLFTDQPLQAPWTLCPCTTDQQQATEWLEWSSVGLEGLVFKRLGQRYLPGRRAWRVKPAPLRAPAEAGPSHRRSAPEQHAAACHHGRAEVPFAWSEPWTPA
jgi:hypothetical protein